MMAWNGQLLVSGVLILLISSAGTAQSQQIADARFMPIVAAPMFRPGKGPIVQLDEAHNNYHTASGLYRQFAAVLRRDGYVVKSLTQTFNARSLGQGRILVISNALHESDKENWAPPNPSAFSDAEVAAVRQWVSQGGSLMIIADHLPFAGAAQKLASTFGVHLNNGYATESNAPPGPTIFSRSNGRLLNHSIARGRTSDETVDLVATFSGSAFQLDQGEPLLRFGDAAVAFMPMDGNGVTADTPSTPIDGWLQVQYFTSGRDALRFLVRRQCSLPSSLEPIRHLWG